MPKRITLRAAFLACAAVLLLSPSTVRSQDIQTPEAFFGHRMGADYRLASWDRIVEYFRHVDDRSDRVKVRELGKTTEGRPLILAEISAPETMANLPRHRDIQRRLADPRRMSGPEEERNLIAGGKTVTLVNCSLHSTEIAATQMAPELLYDLASGDTPEIREILDHTIVLLVPSANPDGHVMVTDWYARSLGKPWEGGDMPWLYHKYAGHDNNRDWFMLNLQETRLLTRVLYEEWFPQIIYDIHQMGSAGPRYFVPPFFDPRDPNIPPMTDHLLLLAGGHMAANLTAAGKRGVIYGAMYDNWWHGGFRSTVYRHNMVGLLTEAASVRLATPIFQERKDLRGGIRGLAEYTMTANFPDPWPGGWWRLRDIVEYEKISCMSLFTLAARYREDFLSNTVSLARTAVERGRTEPPFAWLVPPDQRDPGAVARMLEALHATGVEVHRSEDEFTADGVSYPAGTFILYCAQPYRAHLNDMMEVQKYPERLRYPGGPPEPPYDIAGWTLPLQMGVRRVAVSSSFDCRSAPLDSIPRSQTAVSGSGGNFVVRAGANDDFRLANRLHRAGVPFRVVAAATEWRDGAGRKVPAGSFFIPGGKAARELPRLFDGLSCSVARAGNPDQKAAASLRVAQAPRIALYESWSANADAGWTRLVLDDFEFPYTVLRNAELRAGNLRNRFDCIILPSHGANAMIEGRAPESTEPLYTGGIGAEGVVELQRFVREGGTLVCIDQACTLPIGEFAIPVKNALAGKKTEEFYCPGSILRVRLNGDSPLSFGLPEEVSGYFARSLAFDVGPDSTAKKEKDRMAESATPVVTARYADTGVLESGWIRGEEHIAGKPAVAEVSLGRGKIVLLGFRVQYRAQSWGTFRLLFNAIQGSALKKAG